MSKSFASAELEAGPVHLDHSAFSSVARRRLSAPGLRTFLAIANLWSLSEEQRRIILGMPPRSTYQSWVRAVREHRDILLDVDVLTRISAVLGIHQALGILHATEAEGLAWLRGPHHAIVFGGKPPIEMMTNGSQDALLTVRRFLDGARGGLYMAPNVIDRGATLYTDADLLLS